MVGGARIRYINWISGESFLYMFPAPNYALNPKVVRYTASRISRMRALRADEKCGKKRRKTYGANTIATAHAEENHPER
jgi:hypothetical protein